MYNRVVPYENYQHYWQVSNYNRLTPRICSKSLPFSLVIDELARHIQDNIPLCMLFVNDIVLVDENKIKVNHRLKLWGSALEYKDFK